MWPLPRARAPAGWWSALGSLGHRWSNVCASSATVATTCSQSSRSRRARIPPMDRAIDSSSDSRPCFSAPTERATALATRFGSRTDASSTSHARPTERSPSRIASACARRLLPTPPTPVSVRSRSLDQHLAELPQLLPAPDDRSDLGRQGGFGACPVHGIIHLAAE